MKPGWNDHVRELHVAAKEAFKSWVLSGKPRHGPECTLKKIANARFKYALRFITRNEQAMRANQWRMLVFKGGEAQLWPSS